MRLVRLAPVWAALAVPLALSLRSFAGEPFVKNTEERQRIEQAIPAHAPARPAKPRRLLIFTLNVGYGGHPSIAYASEAFTMMGRKTGAFETTVSDDPAVFERDSLKQFDAVFFNNTVGNCFTNTQWRQNLLEHITSGAGLLGVHGTTVAFTQWPGAAEDWPEFGFLIGARGANHKDSTEHLWIKLDDRSHPINAVFGGEGFEYRDEFFRPQGTYSRKRVRVLLSIDTSRSDPNAGQPRGNCFREDNDYALAWVRNYGRGRVFYSTIAHNPYVFWDAKMLQFYLAAAQFALGDLPAPTTPSARLSPALRAEERLGWRFELGPSAFTNCSLFEAIEQAAALGVPYIGASGSQRVNAEIPGTFGPDLTDAQLTEVRLKLEAAGLRLLTYEADPMPEDPAARRRLFEFGNKMGIETFIASPKPEALDAITQECSEYGIGLAIRNRDRKIAVDYWSAERMLRASRGRPALVGACIDIGAWMRSGVDPADGLRLLKHRVRVVQVHDLNSRVRGHDVPWGTGVGRPERWLKQVAALKLSPVLFTLDVPGDSDALTQKIKFFQTAVSRVESR